MHFMKGRRDKRDIVEYNASKRNIIKFIGSIIILSMRFVFTRDYYFET